MTEFKLPAHIIPWLMNEVADGLKTLIILRLAEGPSLESVAAVAVAWCNTLQSSPIAWDRSLDAPRLREAFQTLQREQDRWPAPKRLLESLPPRPLPKLLPPAPPSHEEAVEILKILKVNKDLVGSKIAERKIQEEKERAERHQRWVEHIEQKKRDFAAMAKIMGDKPNV